MAKQSHPRGSIDDDDIVVDVDTSSVDDATATEETALLSGSSSATLGNEPSSANTTRPRATSDAGSLAVNHPVGWPRGFAVGLSLFLLIFIQGMSCPCLMRNLLLTCAQQQICQA